MGTLWDTVPSEHNLLSNLKFKELSKEDLDNLDKERLKKQEICSHSEAIRFGPSYVGVSSGSYMKSDGYFCTSCALSTEKPIGIYADPNRRNTRGLDEVMSMVLD